MRERYIILKFQTANGKLAGKRAFMTGAEKGLARGRAGGYTES
jgi:hypothetical protein